LFKKKKKSAVHVVLDRSGSMAAIKRDTIGAFNEYVSQLAKDSPNTIFSLTIFDSESIDTVIDNEKITEVEPLTEETYSPRGMTPLYDAIGKVVDKLNNIEAKDKVLVILTDGEENCSQEYNKTSIKKSLDEKQEKENWLVLYLGANQDAFAEGAKFGTQAHTTMNFNPSNIRSTFTASANATGRYLKSGNRADASFTTEERNQSV
jgi:hypothetical protein